ncbi:MAG: hypothetical protein JWR19_4311 [Pedosphaera sp.]|nr:hypothetical protein [Pedosphaera sp.]
MGRFGAFAAEGGGAVVDAAVIDEGAARRENGGGGGDFGAGEFDEMMLRVAEDADGEAVLLGVLANVGGGFVGVGVDEPEADAALGISVLEAADLRGVVVGDGTIVADKNEDGGGGVGAGEGVLWLAVQIYRELVWGGAAEELRADYQQSEEEPARGSAAMKCSFWGSQHK